jgi:hypothetical protein
MKKLLLLLSLHFVFANAFSQNIIFQENFEKGILNEAWKITSGKWYVANLQQKEIKPLAGDNNFALASAGNAEIIIDIPVENINSKIPLQLSFTYWVHSKGSKGLASIELLNERANSITSIQFEALPEKGKWDLFSKEFSLTKDTKIIRLKFGERAAWGSNTVYFKKVSVSDRRR